MARTLKEQIGKEDDFASAQVEAKLNIYRTSSFLGAADHALFKRHQLSPASYNLLRILRGHARKGEAVGVRASEIGCEMVVRMPDVTRLVDRLEGMGLVTRSSSVDDKRVKFVAITNTGLDLLGRLDPQVEGLAQSQLGHMTNGELRDLSRLLERARNEDGDQGHNAQGGTPS